MAIVAGQASSDHNQNPGAAADFGLTSGEVGRHLLGKDSTAQVFSSLRFMDSVEDWVLNRLAAGGDKSASEKVDERLRRLSDIVQQYRHNIPADNQTVLQALAWLNSSMVVCVLDYLVQFQPSFLEQLLGYSKANKEIDVNAQLMLKRFNAMARTRLLDRILGPDNVEFVMRIAVEEGGEQ